MAVPRFDTRFFGCRLSREQRKREADATIRRTEYGARIEYADGRVTSLWAFALDEPVMDVALRRAQRGGAKRILSEPDR